MKEHEYKLLIRGLELVAIKSHDHKLLSARIATIVKPLIEENKRLEFLVDEKEAKLKKGIYYCPNHGWYGFMSDCVDCKEIRQRG